VTSDAQELNGLIADYRIGWNALKRVCHEQHDPQPGELGECICGRSGRNREACRMLAVIRQSILSLHAHGHDRETIDILWAAMQ
jgi:hypothetical protein